MTPHLPSYSVKKPRASSPGAIPWNTELLKLTWLLLTVLAITMLMSVFFSIRQWKSWDIVDIRFYLPLIIFTVLKPIFTLSTAYGIWALYQKGRLTPSIYTNIMAFVSLGWLCDSAGLIINMHLAAVERPAHISCTPSAGCDQAAVSWPSGRLFKEAPYKTAMGCAIVNSIIATYATFKSLRMRQEHASGYYDVPAPAAAPPMAQPPRLMDGSNDVELQPYPELPRLTVTAASGDEGERESDAVPEVLGEGWTIAPLRAAHLQSAV